MEIASVSELYIGTFSAPRCFMPVKDGEAKRGPPEMAAVAPHWPDSFKEGPDYGIGGWHQNPPLNETKFRITIRTAT